MIYKLVEANSAKELNRLVNDATGWSWRPHGSPVVVAVNGGFLYCQALVKH